MSIPLNSRQWGEGGEVRTVHVGALGTSQVHVDPEKVRRFAKEMRRGGDFPAVVASMHDGHIEVKDGHNRLAGARMAGRSTIKVRVYR